MNQEKYNGWKEKMKLLGKNHSEDETTLRQVLMGMEEVVTTK